MTQINQYDMNNVYYPQQKQLSAEALPRTIQIPDFYNVSAEDKQSFREMLKTNPLTAIPYEFFLRGTEHPIPTLLTWLGVSFGLDA